MISKEFRRKLLQHYNIEESSINRPIHYRIPDNVGINIYLKYHNLKELILNQKISKISNSKTLYTIKKENNIRQIKNNIQRNKIEIEFSKTYNKINCKRNYRPSKYITPKRKLETISLLRKEKIKDELINTKNFFNSVFKRKYFRNRDNFFIEKQNTWSKLLLEQKNIKKYKNRYKIKYIDTLPSFHKKIYENHKYQRDRTIPKIIKLNTPNIPKKTNFNRNVRNFFKPKMNLTDEIIKNYNSIVNSK